MHVHTAAELRAQAAHARRLADEMYNRDAQADLRKIADSLEAEAEELERSQAPNELNLVLKVPDAGSTLPGSSPKKLR